MRLRDLSNGSGPICRRILGALPTWFGIPDAVEDYVAVSDRTPTFVASSDGEDVGILTVLAHNRSSAEIYVMGVVPEYHPKGSVASWSSMPKTRSPVPASSSCKSKTLSAAHPDEGYRKTREADHR